MMKILLAYVPVLHQGYLDFICRHESADTVYLFGRSVINDFDWLKRKDIRAIDPTEMCKVLSSICPNKKFLVLEKNDAAHVRTSGKKLIFADEQESRQIASDLFSGCEVSFDRVFLRWDKQKVIEEHEVNAFSVTSDEFHQRFMQQAFVSSEKSPDWWRQVGAMLVSGDKKVLAYNKHVPSDHVAYAFGDPRSFFSKGVSFEITDALHAELSVMGRAFKEGISPKGARLYVTTFPCPYCAAFLSETGIAELYFYSGYSVLNGVHKLANAGIKIYKVSGMIPPL